MKTILHIAEPFATGVFMFVVNLANEQCKKYNVVIAHGMRPLTHSNYESFFDKRIKLVKVENFRMKIDIMRDIAAIKEVSTIIKDVKPDIIHMHSSMSGVIGRIAAFKTGIPQFYSPHGFSFLKLDDSKIKRFVYKTIEFLFSKMNCIIVASSRGEYVEANKITKKTVLINNGINIKQLDDYLNCSSKNERLKICTLGRILDQKNPTQFNHIADNFKDLEFTWIGEGELKNLLTSENIRITGWGPREEALQEMSNADVFILTSLWEGLPLSLLEAMYLKKICLVSNVIGNKDVIVSKKNGLICNNTEDFVLFLKDILFNKEKYLTLAEQAHIDVENEYSIDKMNNEYLKLYNI